MSEAWTTAELIVDVRRQGGLSDDDPDSSDAEILTALNRAQKTIFVPAIRKVRAEYYVTHAEQTLVADQGEYRIPNRAATNSVRQVFFVDSSGRFNELTPVSLGDIIRYPTPGRPVRYAVKDDRLVLLPAPSSALGTLRILFERRPSTLISTSGIQTVVTAGVSTGQGNTVSGVDYLLTTSGLESALGGSILDIVRAKPPFSLSIRDGLGTFASIVILGPPTDFLVFTSGSWDNLPDTGDYLCPAGETCIPQLPVELHPMLALAAAVKLTRPQDIELARELQVELDMDLPRVLASLAPRQQGKQQKLRSDKSYLRRGLGTPRGGFQDWE